MRSPRVEKRFRKIVFDLELEETAGIYFQPDFDFSATGIPNSLLFTTGLDLIGGGAFWNQGNWNEFLWNAQILSQTEKWIPGSGINMGLLIYSSSDLEKSYILHGLVTHWTPRVLRR